jgi:V/A-type H+-transporting ATPase subunit I
MAIVPVSKITLCGITDDKEAVLDDLQRLGCAHLESLNPRKGEDRPNPGYSVNAHKALKYLRTCPTERRQVRNPEGFDFAAVEREALEIQVREQELQDERDFLLKAIEAVEPWGDFRLPAEKERGALRFWFYKVPRRRMEAVEQSGLVWQAVARDERFDYVVVVHPDRPQNMPVAPQELDSRSLSQLKGRLREIERELEHLEWRRCELTRWCRLFEQAMAEADDQAVLEHASLGALEDSGVFAVQGWVPHHALPQVEQFAQQRGLAISVKEPGPDDNPPTLLTNPEPLAGGEGTVTFYMTPGYHTWDPSIVVFFSFALFFAMILSDAGYGALLGVILVFSWRKLSKTRTGVRFRNLFLALVLASVGYGILVGSYFGLSPAPGAFLARFHVLDANDRSAMMRLSVIVGAFHLMLAHAVTAWRYRGSPRFLGPLGWVAMIFGGLILGLNTVGDKFLGLPSAAGTTLLVGGIGAVLLFSSDLPFSFDRISHLAWRLLHGLQNLTGVSKAFGDVLSYMRLFALGLASAELARTFNNIGSDTAAELPGIGILLAILIVLLGHGLNFLLAVMGGVVHGLRLNCIEFFNWSLPEEGYPFEPFCRKANR